MAPVYPCSFSFLHRFSLELRRSRLPAPKIFPFDQLLKIGTRPFDLGVRLQNLPHFRQEHISFGLRFVRIFPCGSIRISAPLGPKNLSLKPQVGFFW